MLFRKMKITGKAREGWGGGGVCRLFSVLSILSLKHKA
jgi:hypothetical protein